jgi:putative CocE/NonD family hydrolase
MNDSSPFPPYPDREALYPGLTWTSQYVPVRDGTRLAVDVYLPKSLPTGIRLPTLLVQSRYWRAMQPAAPLSWFIDDLEEIMPILRDLKPFFVRRGYALVYADVRGTGASFGAWRCPWEPISVQDACDLLDWIVAQPWSSGQVGGMGISYLGTTAELLLATRHPAVKAVVPMYNHPDPYVDIAFPGGLFNHRFIRDWSEMDRHLDRNQIPPMMGRLARWMARGVRPVNKDQTAVDEAVSGHSGNGNTHQIAHRLTFRDEVEAETGVSPDSLALHNYQQAILESQIPSYGWGSWQDAGTAAAALRRFLTYPGANHVTIGAWNHGGMMQASPYRPARAPISPPMPEQWREIIRFFDAYLKEVDNGIQGERLVNYYTLGLELWQHSPTWPPPGVSEQRWYFSSEHALSLAPPTEDSGEDHYTVDFRASTGNKNRWWELSVALNQTVEYGNRSEETPHLLTYLTPALERDIELCGNPLIRLQAASSTTDCAFIVYLEDVAPDGQIFYLTEGQLRAIHRRTSSTPPPYTPLGTHHSFNEGDAWPLVPGEVAEISFGLLPVSALIRAGHRLRLSLAGHDRGTFLRAPSEGTPEWRIMRNSTFASWVELPIKDQGS